MKCSRLILTILGCLAATFGLAQKNNGTSLPGSAFMVKGIKNTAAWPTISLPAPEDVKLNGTLGSSLEKGVQRMALPPYSADWVLSDVSFKVKRIFNNYSGDVSGRYLELGVLTSPQGKLMPAALPSVIESVLNYQKPDGHFGVDIDLDKPLIRNSAPVTLLWGNARMLVGLIDAAQKLKDARLLSAAKKLGDFYINSADQLCSPGREAEYHATGTAADSYQVCYFPAMEGLVMLYKVTKDERYLKHAKRMASFFYKFDTLPNDHSHGNLSAWRSILDIYGLTSNHSYLDKAEAKWNAAVNGGFVWPLGGVGEHWYISFNGDEGCSESDWLRFNLDLWRYTGKTRYLDMAERLLKNQYVSNQTPNGGFGMRRLDSGDSGPIATGGAVNEWDFCCSFHGPLGLFFLKSYLATSSAENIYVNFPLNFESRVKAGGSDWTVAVKTLSGLSGGNEHMEVAINPVQANTVKPVAVWLRVPYWASAVLVNGKSVPVSNQNNGYVALTSNLLQGSKFKINFKGRLTIEGRRFTAVKPVPGKAITIEDVSLVQGPNLLFETPARGPGRSKLLVTIDDKGELNLLKDVNGDLVTVALKGNEVTKAQFLSALKSSRKVALMPWPLSTTRRSAFVYDLAVIPADFVNQDIKKEFALRKQEAEIPHYGTNLDKKPELWSAMMPWKFTDEGIFIKGGNIGLIEGKGYKNYRFEFDVILPAEGQGITGWVVNAKDENNCMMLQIQSKDSPYNAPQFKTRQNTLRPLIRRDGQWAILDPVMLPIDLKRGEKHHIVTECKENFIAVYIDNKKAYEQTDHILENGSVGFRVNEAIEQALFSNIRLEKL